MTTYRRFRIAAIIIVIVDASLILWGAMAALMPGHLLGPRGAPILQAGYEGFTAASWQQLSAASPRATAYITLLFRTYGAYCVAFGVAGVGIALGAFRRGDRWAWWALLIGNTIALVSAMRYDWLVRAIGPFELTEYLGLALVWGALAVTAPFRATEAQPSPVFDTAR
jgi:hypothetical protein